MSSAAAITTHRGPGRGKYDRTKSLQQRRRERHERIVLAAIEVFADKGLEATNVADIVGAAGVSRQTFYEHFESVLDCLVHAFDHTINRTFREAELLLRGIEDPIERLRVGTTGYLADKGRNPSLSLVFHREALAAGPEFIARREASYGRWVSLMMEGVAEAYGRGILTRPPDELTAYTLITGMETVALRYLDRGEADRITEAAPALVELAIRAFGGDPDIVLVC